MPSGGFDMFFAVIGLFLLGVAVVLGLGIVVGLLSPLFISVPVAYNFRSIRVRWASAGVAVLGIAGPVGVFIAMPPLARGFRAPLVSSGSADNAPITRAGPTPALTTGASLECRTG